MLYPSDNPLNWNANLMQESMDKAPLTNGQLFEQGFQSFFPDTTVGVAQRAIKMGDIQKQAQEQHSPIYSPDQANELYSDYGVKFNKPVSKIEADYVSQQKVIENTRKQLLMEGSNTFAAGASTFAGGMAAGLLDPINVAAMFIPGADAIPIVKTLGWGKSVAGRMLLRGATDAALTAVAQPLPLWAAHVDQRDYGMVEASKMVLMNGIIGTGFGGIGEGFNYLTKGNKFQTATIGLKEYTNNEVPTLMKRTIESKPPVTTIPHNDLITLPDTLINTTPLETGGFKVQLQDTNVLGELEGHGATVDLARESLRKKVGVLLQNEDIYKGYNHEVATSQLAKDIVDLFPHTDIETMGRVLDNIDLSETGHTNLTDYIHEKTNGFKDHNPFLDELELRIKDEHARQLQGDPDYFAKEVKTSHTPDEVSILTSRLTNLEEKLVIKQKQLDNTKQLTSRQELQTKIDSLNNSIETTKNKLSDATYEATDIYHEIQRASHENALQGEIKDRLSGSSDGLPTVKELVDEIRNKETLQGEAELQTRQEIAERITKLETKQTKLKESQTSGKKVDSVTFEKTRAELAKVERALEDAKTQLVELKNKPATKSEIDTYTKVLDTLHNDTRDIETFKSLLADKEVTREQFTENKNLVVDKDKFLEANKDKVDVDSKNDKTLSDIEKATEEDLLIAKQYLDKFDEKTKEALGISNGTTETLRKAEEEALQATNFKQDFLDYINCRKTEA